jgi:alpha-tubulin suppressor-like RCC1 family protein
MNTLLPRSMRFAVWLIFLAMLFGCPHPQYGQGGNPGRPAGFTLNLNPRTPIPEGQTLTLQVEVNLDVAFPGCFRWFRGSEQLSNHVDSPIIMPNIVAGFTGGYRSVLTIPAAQKSDSGLYYCDVTGLDGNVVRSQMVQYLVTSKPNLVLQPESQLLVEQTTLRLSVDAQASAKATMSAPAGVAVDKGDFNYAYVADTTNHLIRRVSPGGTVSLFAGSVGTVNDLTVTAGGAGYGRFANSVTIASFDGENGSGASAEVSVVGGAVSSNLGASVLMLNNPRFTAEPRVVIYDSIGGSRASITSPAQARVSFVSGAGSQDTVAPFPLTAARLRNPEAVAISPDGRLYIADTDNHVIRMVNLRDAAPTMTTVAGLAGFAGFADGTVASPARATAVVTGGGIVGVTITNAGANLGTSIPNVIIPAPPLPFIDGGSQAQATCTVSGGVVTGVTITNPGNGYRDPVDVTFTEGADSPTTAVMPTGRTISAFRVNEINLTARGAGYSLDETVPRPTVTIAPPTSLIGDQAVANTATATLRLSGSVSRVNLESAGGAVYGMPPSVSFNTDETLLAGGTAATATCTLSASGKVTGVTLIQGGSGYQSTPAIEITPAPGDAGFVAGTPPDAQAELTVGVHAQSLIFTSGGGYTGTAPMVTVNGGTQTRLNRPRGLRVDGSGNVFIADSENHAIRILRPVLIDNNDPALGVTYVLSTVAGSRAGISGNTDGSGANATFYGPRDVAIDNSSGHFYVYVADYSNHTIRRIELPVNSAGALILPPLTENAASNSLSSSATVRTYAGTPGSSGFVNGTGLSSRFAFPGGLEVDTAGGAGVLYVSEISNNMVRRITPTKGTECAVNTYAGTESRTPGYTDGASAGAQLFYPKGLSFDSERKLFVAERGNHTIRRINAIGDRVEGYVGVPGVSGMVDSPTGSNPEFHYQWTKDGAPLVDVPAGGAGVNESITGSRSPQLVITGQNLNVNFGRLAETNSGQYAVQVTSTFRGNRAQFTESLPAKVIVRNPDFAPITRNAKVGDLSLPINIGAEVIAAVFRRTGVTLSNPNYVVTTLDGGALPTWMRQVGQGSPEFQVTPPASGGQQTIVFNLVVSDSLQTARGLFLLNIAPYESDGSQKPIITAPPQFQLVKAGKDAQALTVEAQGSGITYQWLRNGVEIPGETSATLSRNATKLSDAGFYSVAVTNSKGTVTSTPAQLVVVGAAELVSQPQSIVLTRDNSNPTSTQILSVDALAHTQSLFNYPHGLALNKTSGEFYLADQQNSTIRKVRTSGETSLLAGSPGQSGDNDSTGVGARFNFPSGLSVTSTGDLLVADTENNKVRRVISPDRVQSALPGLNKPQAVVSDNKGNLFISDTDSHVIRVVHSVESVIGVKITEAGAGFLTGAPPLVEFSDLDSSGAKTGGTGASAIAVVGSEGRLISINVTNPGTGYQSAPVVKFYTYADAAQTVKVEDTSIAAIAEISGTLSTNVNILSGGSAYKAAPTVKLSGGGVAPATATAAVDPTTGALKQITVTNGGAGYNSRPSVLITPVSGGTGASASATFVDGRVTRINVEQEGEGYVKPPIVTLIGGGINLGEVSVSMGVGALTLTSAGQNYTKAPTVRIESADGNGSGAEAVTSVGITSAPLASTKGLKLAGNGVKNAGSGFLPGQPPTFTVPNSPIVGGTAQITAFLGTGLDADKVVWVRVNPGRGYTSIENDDITVIGAMGGFQLSDVSLVEVGGGRYTLPPTVTVTGGGGTGATARPVLGVGTIDFDPRTGGGSGYTTTPRVTVSGGGGSGAEALASMGINEVKVDSNGSGYTAPPVVQIVGGGGGSGAKAEALLGLNSAKIDYRGENYAAAPTVTFTPSNPDTASFQAGSISVGLIAAGGGKFAIQTLAVVTPGRGYKLPPEVSFIGGGGGGAIATATIDAQGRLTGCTIDPLNSGLFTSMPTVQLSGPARAVALMSIPLTTGSYGTSAIGPNPGNPGLVNNTGNSNFLVPPLVEINGGGFNTVSYGVAAKAVAVMGVRPDTTFRVNGAQNYNGPPTITIVGGSVSAASPVNTGSVATAVAVMGVNSVNLTSGGSYMVAPSPNLVVTGTINTGSLTVTATIGANTLAITPSGTANMGYTGTLTISAGTTGLAVAGTMGVSGTLASTNSQYSMLNVISGGTYTAVPTFTFPPAPPSGANANATSLVAGFGLRSVAITNGGSYSLSWVQANPPDTKAVSYFQVDLPPNTFGNGIPPVFSNGGSIGLTPSLGIRSGTASLTGAISVTAGGTYTSAPTVAYATGGLQNTTAIMGINTVTMSGTGRYLQPGTLSFPLSSGTLQGGSSGFPVISFSGGTGATASPLVTYVIPVASAGTGYTVRPTITLTGGLSGGTASVNVGTVSGGSVTTVTVTLAGGGTWTSFPEIRINGGTATTRATFGKPYFQLNGGATVAATTAGRNYSVASHGTILPAPSVGVAAVTNTLKVVDLNVTGPVGGLAGLNGSTLSAGTASFVRFTGGGGSGAVAQVQNLTMVSTYWAGTTTTTQTGRGYSSPTQMNFRFKAPDFGQAAAGTVSYAITDVGMPWGSGGPSAASTGRGYISSGTLIVSGTGGASIGYGLSLREAAITNRGSGFTGAGTFALTVTPAPAVAPPVSVSVTSWTVTALALNNNNATIVGTPTLSFTGGTLHPAGSAAFAVLGASTFTGIRITNPGYGYTSRPTFQVTGGGGGTFASISSTLVTGGTITSSNGTLDLFVRGIRVTDGGSGYQNRDSVRVNFLNGTVPNDTFRLRNVAGPDWRAGLEMTGIRFDDFGNVYGDTIPKVGFTGPNFAVEAEASIDSFKVTGVKVADRGSNYTATPSVNFVPAGGGTGAAATVSGMRVVWVELSQSGSGYTARPDVTFTGGGGSGAVAAVDSLKVLSVNITNPGRNYRTAPSSITVNRAENVFAENATVDVPTGLGVNGISIVKGGSGYTKLPNIIIEGDGSGSGAKAEAVGLSVNNVTVTKLGGGYATAPNLSFSPVPTNVGATADTETVGQGASAEISPMALLGLSNIGVMTAGSGYLYAPDVVITGGGGNGATATATVTGGVVTKIEITNPGADYTSAPKVTLVNGLGDGGVAATAVATVRQPVYTIGTPDTVGFRDGNIDSSVLFNSPRGLSLDKNGSLYVCDTANSVIRKISSPLVAEKTGRRTFKVSTVAGLAGDRGFVDGFGSLARFKNPEGIVCAQEGITGIPAGALYVTDTGNHTIRVISPSGSVSTLAGIAGSAGQDNGGRAVARFSSPKGIDLDQSGFVYVTDQSNHMVRRISTGGQTTVTTVAGVGGLAGAVNSDGVNEYTYQWRKDGVSIGGATGSTYAINNLDGAAGSYDVVVTNVAGSITSAPAVVQDPALTTIVSDLPALVKGLQGDALSLSVTVTAFPTPEYQWYRRVAGNWEPIVDGPDWKGAKTSNLTLYRAGAGPNGDSTGLQPGHSGAYKVKIGATTESRVGEVQVVHKPILGNILRNVTSISSGGQHALALHQDNTLWTWGLNSRSQLGNRSTDLRPLPIQVGIKKWAQVSAGANHSVALAQNGAVHAWGDNSFGQLGNGGNLPITSAEVQMGTETKWIAVAAGDNHTLAIKADRYYGPKTSAGWGTKQADGSTVYYSIQNDLVASSVSPTAAWLTGSGEPAASVGAVGDYFIDVSAGGTLWGWGANDYGQLGDEPNRVVLTPQQITLPSLPPELPSKARRADPQDRTWKSISAGAAYSAGIIDGGTLLTWGRNDRGQLGDNTNVSRGTPTAIPEIRFKSISAGSTHMLALDDANGLWTWGANEHYKLGQSSAGVAETLSFNPTPTPVSVDGVTRWIAVAAGSDHSLAIGFDNDPMRGSLYSWGGNANGQAGDGTTLDVPLPVLVSPAYPDDKVRWEKIAAGQEHSLGLTSDGMLWSWGLNGVGQIGNAALGGAQLTPTRIGGQGLIFVDSEAPIDVPVMFHTAEAPAFIRVAVLENGLNPGNVNYVWTRGSSLRLPGAFTTTLPLQNPISSGSYRLTVSNDQGTAVSPAVSVLRLPATAEVTPAELNAFKEPQIGTVGNTIRIYAPKLVKFGGDESAAYNNPTYQWTRLVDGNPVALSGPEFSGTNSGTLVITGGSLTHSGTYQVTATLNFGNRFSDDFATGVGEMITRTYTGTKVLTVVQLPDVKLRPLPWRSPSATIEVERGEPISLGVSVAATSPAPLSAILVPAGGTGNGYRTAPTVTFDGGGGSGATAVASVSGGTVTAVNLVNRGSGYTSVPNVIFTGGDGIGATATAVIDAGVVYKWFKGTNETNGQEIPDSNSSEYRISSSTDPSALDRVSGIYTVKVKNTAGEAGLTDDLGNSAAWNVVLQSAPRIVVEPARLTELLTGSDVTLSVTASASSKPDPVTYQWYVSQNGGTAQAIVEGDTRLGATGVRTPSLKLTGVTAANEGQYSVTVTNNVKGVTRTATSSSTNGIVKIISSIIAPSIATNGMSGAGTYVQGSLVRLRVTATGSPLNYQWYRDRVMLPGQTGPQMTIASIQPGEAGLYTVQVSNAQGTREASARVMVARSGATVAMAVVTVDRSTLTRFASSPSIPLTGQLPVGTRLKLSGVAPAGSALRGWVITNTPDAGTPQTVTLLGSTVQFVLGSGATTITAKVGRGFSGNYSGLLTTDSPLDAFGNASVVDPSTVRGTVVATVSTLGRVSGRISVEGQPYPFVTVLDSKGTGPFSITARHPITKDRSKITGTVQVDAEDGSDDAGLRVVLGSEKLAPAVTLPPVSASGGIRAESKILYSLCGTSTNAVPANSAYTAAICRYNEWSSLGRGGCLTLQVRGGLVIAFGYLGNGSSFTYSGTPSRRFGEEIGEDWDEKVQLVDGPVPLADLAMGEMLIRQSGSIAVPIYTSGESSQLPLTNPLIGALVFSGQGIIGSIGLLDVASPNTANAVSSYSSNLVRGYPFTTSSGTDQGLLILNQATGATNSATTLLAAPFDSDGMPVGLYSSVSYPNASIAYPLGLAIDALSLRVSAFGSSFVRRVPPNPQLEPVASNVTDRTGAAGVAAVRWVSISGATSSTPDTGLFNVIFNERNSDFQVSDSRVGTTPKVLFSGNSESVTTKLYGVVLQSTDVPASPSNNPPGGYAVPAGGHGFLIRGSTAESRSNTLGLGEVEAAVNALNPSIKTYRTEAIQLLRK